MTGSHPYCQKSEYSARTSIDAFDDRAYRDEWQDGVYAFARRVAINRNARAICDYGCGSGFKLMKYFSDMDTIGIEVDPCYSFLMETYPGRKFKRPLMSEDDFAESELVISADVIEHLNRPDLFLRSIQKSKSSCVILSTPALEILADRGDSPRLGPPRNQSHFREWTTSEFRQFVESYIPVSEHFVSNVKQATQVILSVRESQ